MAPPGADLAFRARALAQAHPLSAAASEVIDETVRRRLPDLPVEEMGHWMATAMATGYCVRAVEEEGAGRPGPPAAVRDLDRLEGEADALAAMLRAGDEAQVTVGPVDEVVGALDAVIGGEIAKRVDPWREQVGDDAWRSFEDFVAHYVVRGYAIRAAETAFARSP